jgi:hypothetical protein
MSVARLTRKRYVDRATEKASRESSDVWRLIPKMVCRILYGGTQSVFEMQSHRSTGGLLRDLAS